MAPPFSPVALDSTLSYDATLTDIERRVRAGVRPDRLRLGHNERALYWVCQSSRLRSDGPDEATVAQRIRAKLEVIQLLLSRGANPNRIAARGATPLSVCCRDFTGYPEPWALEKLQLLLAAGANPRLTRDSPLCTLLGLRDMRGEVFTGVLEADALPAKQAVVFQAIDALLQAGAPLDGMDHREMYTPLLLASYLGSLPLVRFLVDRGANVHATNPAGTNALMQAAGDAEGLKGSRAGISSTWHRFGDPVAVTRQLLDWGIDPAVANVRGRTPLKLAVNAGNLDVAAVLAEALAAQGKLLKADVRLFKGSPFEPQVTALSVGVRTPTPPRTQARPEGAAQTASWVRARQDLHHPGAWQRPEWYCAYNKALFEHLAGGAHPGIPPQRLYVDYTDALRTIRISKTKDWVSRGGVVTIQPDVVSWDTLRISYAQLEGNAMPCREEVVMPLSAENPPGLDAVTDLVGRMCARYFKLPLTTD